MLEPEHTGECLRCARALRGHRLLRHALLCALLTLALRRMAEAVDVPVSVKCRVCFQLVSLRLPAF